MPGDQQPVSKGDRLRIPAAAWNLTNQNNADFLRRRAGRTGPPGAEPDDFPGTLWVFVRNDSGADRDRGDILTPTEELLGATDQPLSVQRLPVFAGEAPASTSDPVLVLLEPIAEDAIGRAAVIGIAVCTVNVSDASHGFARPTAGNTDRLESAAGGPARVLDRDDGSSGDKVATVLLGTCCGTDGGGGDPGGSGTDCSSLLTLTPLDCVLATVSQASGLCANNTVGTEVQLYTGDGLTWASEDDFTAGTVSGPLVFTKPAAGDPLSTATLTIDGVPLGNAGCVGGKLRFTSADEQFCTGSYIGCNNKFSIDVACKVCTEEACEACPEEDFSPGQVLIRFSEVWGPGYKQEYVLKRTGCGSYAGGFPNDGSVEGLPPELGIFIWVGSFAIADTPVFASVLHWQINPLGLPATVPAEYNFEEYNEIAEPEFPAPACCAPREMDHLPPLYPGGIPDTAMIYPICDGVEIPPITVMMAAAKTAGATAGTPAPTPGPKKTPKPPCRHLGPATGKTVECKSCAGKVSLKVFGCGVFGECTAKKRHDDIAGCCKGCEKYEAAEG